MQYTTVYQSPLGKILLAAGGASLTGLWFEGQNYYARTLDESHTEKDLPVFAETARWLDRYFSGREPEGTPPLSPAGTPFQLEVWALLRQIPYGATTTYSALARELGRSASSARAVGAAIGRNPISLLIPCHRVLGAGGALTGYAGGLDRKRRLLALERAPSEII